MKKLFASVVIFAFALGGFAQAPAKMSYQCVVRNTAGSLVVNHTVGVKTTISQGSPVKVIVYTETYSPLPQTNANGLLTLEIGGGTPSTGNFSSINWQNGPFYLKTEIDPAGGTNYTITGESQILSVPYALYAEKAGSLPGYVPDIRTLTINGVNYSLSDNRSWDVGTVTSVGLSLPDIFTVSNSPVTTNGTIGVNLAFASPNLVFATPKLLFGAPSFRALDNNDIPDLDWSKITSGKPTTLAGYGITDGVTKAYIDSLLDRIEELETVTDKVKDVDGNLYSVVKIGSQYWMGQNLKTSKYNDSNVIPYLYDAGVWAAATTPGWCWYNNNGANKNEYGALYNYYTVLTHKLCPVGWHVPNITEWSTLINYLGGSDVAGGKLKEAGTSHWLDPNTGATNEAGFTALPGGYRKQDGGFSAHGESGAWWSEDQCKVEVLDHDHDLINTAYLVYYNYASSVRCLKDEKPISFYDVDGNKYSAIKIGNQVWMTENLKTTHLNNGTAIPEVTDAAAWGNLTTPGYCMYNNNAANKATYGLLYNWYTVNSGNLCPTGWHVPTDWDWTILTNSLGGESLAGGPLKEAGTTYWASPNVATNSTGFCARPGGYRDINGGYYNSGQYGYWWSSTPEYSINAYIRVMINSNTNVTRTWQSQKNGMSVRCVKD